MKRFSVPALTICLLAAFAAISFETLASSGSSNWAQWRGPQSQGISEDKNLPSEWSATKNVQWKTAIEGRGHSSPIVWGKRIFLTTGIEGAKIADPKPPIHMIEGKEFKHPAWAGHDHTLDVQGHIGGRRDGQGALGEDRPTKARRSTTATAKTPTRRRRPRRTESTSTLTSGLRASTATTTAASWCGKNRSARY